MRILVLLHEAFGGRGGIAKFNRDFIAALCEHPGVSAVTAIPLLAADEPGPLPQKLSYPTVGVWGKAGWLLRVGLAASSRSRYDLIVCGHINLLPAAFAVRWLNPAPVALIVHGIEAWHRTGQRVTDALAGRIDLLISVSRVTRSRFFAWSGGETRSAILPNTIDTAYFTPGQPDPALLRRWGMQDRRVVLTLARLESRERYKGIDEIIDVLPSVAAEFPDLVYVIAGDGSDRARLETKVRDRNLGDRVVFTGYVPEAEKRDLYRAADVFAMPGHGEGFGIVYLEAMACGTPVIASKLDGSREAVREGMLGLIVNPTDPAALRAAIRSALSQPKGAVPQGLDYFDLRHFNERVRRIVDQLRQTSAQTLALPGR
jgi:glycosyltransferase involved in cell wall biosynthesis